MSAHKKSQSFEDLTGTLAPDGVDVPDDKLIDDIYAEKVTKHAADAIDYEDIDELADEELSEKETLHPTEDGPQPLQPQYLQLEEQDQQVVAENEFDNIFGGDDLEVAENANQDSDLDAIGDSALDSAHGLHDFSVSAGFEDDGLHDMGLGFEDEEDYIQSATVEKANKNKSSEEIAARTTKLRKVVQDLETSYKSRMLAKYFPQYRKDKMFNFNTIVLLEYKFYGYKRPAIARRSHQKSLLPLKLTLEMEPDQRKAFKFKKGIDSSHFVIKGIRTVTAEDMDLIRDLQSKSDLLSRIEMVPLLKQDGDESDKFSEFDKNLILATADWDDKNIISAGESDDELPRKLPQISEKFEPEEISYDDEDIFNGDTIFKM